MTDVENKTVNYLKLLGFNELSTIDEKTLKQAYLKNAKIYHPDTCQNESYKDGKMFSAIKEAYDFLSNDINRTNETINNILNPNNKTYNYQDEFMYENQYANGGTPFQGYAFYSGQNIKPKDKPSIFSMFLCFIMPFMGFFMFVMTKRIMPKASKWYAIASVLGIVVTLGMNFLM